MGFWTAVSRLCCCVSDSGVKVNPSGQGSERASWTGHCSQKFIMAEPGLFDSRLLLYESNPTCSSSPGSLTRPEPGNMTGYRTNLVVSPPTFIEALHQINALIFTTLQLQALHFLCTLQRLLPVLCGLIKSPATLLYPVVSVGIREQSIPISAS